MAPSDAVGAHRAVLYLYGHVGCCLCDRLKQMLAAPLQRLQQSHHIELTHRDIADDPAWRRAYGERIPVLTFGKQVVLEGRPDEQAVAAALAALPALLGADAPPQPRHGDS